MIPLNLQANGKEQQLIKAYLEQNASVTLAEKINNGVYIEKDGKRLLNKKTLDGFMKFAVEEARKLAEKNARAACVEDKVVYGWATHYFEEESIIGTLYTEDGTLYKKPVTVTAKPNTKVVPVTSPAAPKPQKQQTSIFDMLTGGNADENSDNSSILPPQLQNEGENDESDEEDYDEDEICDENEDEDEITPIISPVQSKMQGSPLYQKYMELQSKFPNHIVVMRLGDFYEVFGNSAVTLAEELNLTLTGRDVGLDERVPLIGFPYHAADNYFIKIHAEHDMVVYEDKDNITPIPKKPVKAEPEKHWIDDTTYVDDDGVVYHLDEEKPETEPPIVSKLKELIGLPITVL